MKSQATTTGSANRTAWRSFFREQDDMKTKVDFKEFQRVQSAIRKEGTVAYWLQRRIDDAAKPGARPIGSSALWMMRALQRDPIGEVQVTELTPTHLLDHGRYRKSCSAVRSYKGSGPKEVKAVTIGRDFSVLRSTVQQFVDVDELDSKILDVFRKAKKRMEKEQLVAKGTARTRRPTPQEVDLTLAYCKESGRSPMPVYDLFLAGLMVGRRISELCRLRWEDMDDAKKTCLVRDLKNPAGKGYHAAFPCINQFWELVQRQSRYEGFPFIFSMQASAKPKQLRAASVSAFFTRARKDLAAKHPGLFKDLRLHDNRRECFTQLFKSGWNVPQVQAVSLHKGDAKTLLGTYTNIEPESVHALPQSNVLPAPATVQ